VAKTGKKKKALTVRGKALHWLSTHRGLTEQPANSNTDTRSDGIRAAQMRLGAWLVGLAWCGVWAANALLAAGVRGVSWRLASVNLIEDDARAGRAPFRDWLAPTVANMRRVLRGDLVVLFGRGVHVGVVRAFKFVRGVGWVVITDEGNTSSGNAGSQSNGGGSYRRERPLNVVHGFARVDYPGGGSKLRAVARAAALVGASAGAQVVGVLFGHDVSVLERHAFYSQEVGSDALMLAQVRARRGENWGAGDEQLVELEELLTRGAA
jgi:hypothetical protein